MAPNAVPVEFGLCYARPPSTSIFLLAGSGHHQAVTIGTTMAMLATSASSVPVTVGTYKVGFCFRNLSAETITLGQVTGFVQVTN